MRLLFCYLLITLSLWAEEPTLILNSKNEPLLPARFRSSLNQWSAEHISPSHKGLNDLNASGSAQFSEKGLQMLLHQIPAKNIVIVDLREESHGFVNGMAISWYAPRDLGNVGKTLGEIEADEKSRLNKLQGTITLQQVTSKHQDTIVQTAPITVQVESTSNEKELTSKYNVGYIRIPVTDHHAPSQQELKRFLDFVKTLPPDTWLHFHCAAGHGRTTTFLVLYDILRNAHQVSFNDILQRQFQLGGMNLDEMPPTSAWKYEAAVNRKTFLQQFYDRCCQIGVQSSVTLSGS